MTDSIPTYVSTALAAELVGLSQRTIQRIIAAGELPAVMLGGGWVVAYADLTQWLNRQLVEPHPRSCPPRTDRLT